MVVVQFSQALFGVGQAVMAILAYYITNWRGLSVAFAIPPICLLILLWIFQDEPARWLLTKRENERAVKILTKMANQNERVNNLK